VTKQRKRVSPENAYDRFYDMAHAKSYDVMVCRWRDGDDVYLQVLAVRGNKEYTAPSVKDVTELATSVQDIHEQVLYD
jgi:hypothetical protein